MSIFHAVNLLGVELLSGSAKLMDAVSSLLSVL
jgi:hypothetical protein